MIESNLIRRFIIKAFMQKSRNDIETVASSTFEALCSRFLLNESVFIRSTRELGKIQRCSKDSYKVLLQDGREVDLDHASLERKFSVTYNDILFFLECATERTAFGYILIEDVFEKISQPDFGAGRVRNHRYDYSDPNQQHQAQPSRSEGFEQSAAAIQQAWEAERGIKQLDLTKLEPFEVEGYTGTNLKYLLKIYMFVHSFADSLSVESITLQGVAEAIQIPDYNSELAFQMHSKLIRMIESEIKAKKEKFYETVRFIFERLPSFEGMVPASATKKKTVMTMDNWKNIVRQFIQNYSRDASVDRFLRFVDFAKKGELGLRLELLAILLDMATYTETFRIAVANKQSVLRAEKQRYDQLLLWKKNKIDGPAEDFKQMEEELKDYPSWRVNHPLKIHLGKYREYPLFVMDRQIMMKDGDGFYRLSCEDVLCILRSLNLRTKHGKNIATVLKTTIDVLYRGKTKY